MNQSDLAAKGRRAIPPGILFIGSVAACGEGRYFPILREALAGGVRAFLLREKDATGRHLFEMALRARAITADAGALLLVSERIDIAIAAGADGVHLPERSFTAAEAREITGGRLLIGRSVHSAAGVLEAARTGADYLLAGPVFPTPGKEVLFSLDELQRIAEGVRLPVVPVGGIDRSNIGRVQAAGFRTTAVIRAIAASRDPRGAAAHLSAELG